MDHCTELCSKSTRELWEMPQRTENPCLHLLEGGSGQHRRLTRRVPNESRGNESSCIKIKRQRADERVEVSETSCPYDAKLSFKANEPQIDYAMKIIIIYPFLHCHYDTWDCRFSFLFIVIYTVIYFSKQRRRKKQEYLKLWFFLFEHMLTSKNTREI